MKDQLYPHGETPGVSHVKCPFHPGKLSPLPSACPSSPTAAICCGRINRGAAPLTSKPLFIMPSDLPTERRTGYCQRHCPSTVLPSRRVGGRKNQQQTFDLTLRWTQRQLQCLRFINLASVLPFVEGRKSRKAAFPLNGFYCVCKHCNCWWWVSKGPGKSHAGRFGHAPGLTYLRSRGRLHSVLWKETQWKLSLLRAPKYTPSGRSHLGWL